MLQYNFGSKLLEHLSDFDAQNQINTDKSAITLQPKGKKKEKKKRNISKKVGLQSTNNLCIVTLFHKNAPGPHGHMESQVKHQ